MMPPLHNFVDIVSIIMKFSTDMKLDILCTMVTKAFVTSLPLRKFEIKTCILADVQT